MCLENGCSVDRFINKLTYNLNIYLKKDFMAFVSSFPIMYIISRSTHSVQSVHERVRYLSSCLVSLNVA